MDLSNINNVAFLAFLTPVIAFYKQIQNFILKMGSVVIRTDKIESSVLTGRCLRDILVNSKIIRFGNQVWKSHNTEWIKSFNSYQQIHFKEDYYLFILHKSFIPIFIKTTGAGFSFTYLYKSFNFKKFLTDLLVDEYNKVKTISTFHLTENDGVDFALGKINENISASAGTPFSFKNSQQDTNQQTPISYHYLGKHNQYLLIKDEDIGSTEELMPSYFWSKEAINLRNEIEFWFTNKNWFEDKQIPHTRGVLLHGIPGSGKSKMVLECARYIGLRLYKSNISNMSNKEFVTAYNQDLASHITLIEDIDSIFEGRTNLLASKTSAKNLLSFDTLINTISGVKRDISNFLIITTNNIEKLDPALIRPGRLDVKIEVLPLCKDGRLFIAKNLLSDWPELIDKIVIEKDGSTAAEFENFCIELAVQKFYEKKDLKCV